MLEVNIYDPEKIGKLAFENDNLNDIWKVKKSVRKEVTQLSDSLLRPPYTNARELEAFMISENLSMFLLL